MKRHSARLFHLAVALLIGVGSASAGTVTLAWNANLEPDVARYVIAYGTAPGHYTSTVDVGNRTTWQLSGLAAGQRYYFVAHAYNTRGEMSLPSGEVNAVVLGVSLTSNILPMASTGQPITWKAAASAPSEYQFWRFSSGTWTMAQDYSPAASYTWTPTTGEEGTHQVQVWARVVGSPQGYDAWDTSGSFSIQSGSVVVGALEASVALPASTGTASTGKVRAIGGTGTLQYKYWRYMEGSGCSMARDYSTSNTYTWAPGARE